MQKHAKHLGVNGLIFTGKLGVGWGGGVEETLLLAGLCFFFGEIGGPKVPPQSPCSVVPNKPYVAQERIHSFIHSSMHSFIYFRHCYIVICLLSLVVFEMN